MFKSVTISFQKYLEDIYSGQALFLDAWDASGNKSDRKISAFLEKGGGNID